MNGCPDATTERCEISRNPRKVCKRLIDAVHLRSWDHGLDDRHHALTHVAIYVEWKINQRSGETVELGKQDHALPSWPTDFDSMILGVKPFLILRTKPKRNRLPHFRKVRELNRL